MKALLIDPYDQTVKPVDVPKTNTLHEIYKLLQCQMVECPHRFRNGDVLYCDEEYWLSQHEDLFGFKFQEWADPVMGRALIIGSTTNGNDTDCKSTEDIVSKAIEWFDTVKVLNHAR